MPRDIPVGNGQMLVNFDQHYRMRDLFFPHVGQENHAGVGPCHFGVWAKLPELTTPKDERRKQRVYWSDDGWSIDQRYQVDTLATDVRMYHRELAVELHCEDVVDFHRPLLVRRIDVTNHADFDRDIRLFHHQDLYLYGNRVGDTAYYDPRLRSVVHYRKQRYVMACFYADDEQRVDEYATGTSGFQGAEGTFRDAEDGRLGNNPIAQGAVDSTIEVAVPLSAGQRRTVYLVIGAGHRFEDLQELHRFLHREGAQGVIDRTVSYWKLWLAAARTEFPPGEESGLSGEVHELFKRSLLLVRSQIDNGGAIIAANDSDITQFSRDTYSYLWPRDGAFVADALDAAGFSDASRLFFTFCSKLLTDLGVFLHKYNPDGSTASSWHPWVSGGRPQLPIQEDETALVIWALWRHYARSRDIEFVRPLWLRLIQPAADFLVRYRDPDTHLPLPSHDLWEERFGIHAFTVASVHAGLKAAYQFALCFGDNRRAKQYAQAADQTRQAFVKHMWSDKHQRFLRRINPVDEDRTGRFVEAIMAGGDPRSFSPPPMVAPQPPGPPSDSRAASPTTGRESDRDGQATVRQTPTDGPNREATSRWSEDNPDAADSAAGETDSAGRELHESTSANRDAVSGDEIQFDVDEVIDASMFAIFGLGLLAVDDQRVVKTMQAIENRLWVKTEVGGVARYENDYYHQISQDTANIPGNPWFICTLWLADYYITRASTAEQLDEGARLLEWVAARSLPSGVLAEQVHPESNAPLSVSPLTWSHATFVATVNRYLSKLHALSDRRSGQPTPKPPTSMLQEVDILHGRKTREHLIDLGMENAKPAH